MNTASSFISLNELSNVPEALKGGVVGIGNFDGVHAGHRAVLGPVVKLAEAMGGAEGGVPALAMSFEPHPRTVFKPDNPVFRLSPAPTKARLMKAVGLDGLLNVPFDKAFSQITATSFVEDILLGKLGASHVVVGHDFHFGKGREGTPDFLMNAGGSYGFGVTIVPPHVDDGGAVVSSSLIRKALREGEVSLANELLGYRYFVRGEIIHGEKRGRDLGYPTANMKLPNENDLKHGIYAVQVRFSDGTIKDGVANFGRRPQFDNGAPLLETFLFDFQGDLYGQTLEVILIKWQRSEAKFDGLDALIEQMDRDSEIAKATLAVLASPSEIDQRLSEV